MTEVSMAKAKHFRRRLQERYGITMQDKTFAKFCDIHREKGAALQLSCRIGAHRVNFGGIVVAILWDRKHGVPVTALPEGARIFGTKAAYVWKDGEFKIAQKFRRGKG